MVFRLSGSIPQTQALNFSGSSIEAAGNRVASGIGEAVGALDEYYQKDAELFYQTQMNDFNAALNNDLRELAGQTLGGEGYADAANALFDQRRGELMELAGGNPYKMAMLNRHFAEAEASIREGFNETQLDLSVEYGINSLGRQVDNAMQEASRGSYAASNGGVIASLGFTESGNRYNIQNDEGFTGKYQFGQARLNEYARAIGVGSIDIEEFRRNPEMQEDAMRWHVSDILQFAEENGLNRYIGQTVNGVTVTESGMVAVAHLGGKHGLRRFLTSGGSYNPADSNGTSLTDYLRTHASSETGVGPYSGPPVNIWDNPDLSARRDDIFAVIDAIPGLTANQRDEMRRDAEASLTEAAITRLGQENAPAALDALRSGRYDDALSYRFDQSTRRSLEADIVRAENARMQEVRATAVAQSGDIVAWQMNGRQGQAPADLTTEQYLSLTPSQRSAHDRAAVLGGVVQEAQIVDLAHAGSFLEGLAPSGEGYALEAEMFDAANEVIERRQQDAIADYAVSTARAANIPPNTDIDGVEERLDLSFAETVGASDLPLTAAADWVAENRYVPDGFEMMIGQAMGSDDPQVRRQAVEAVARVNAQNRYVLANVSNPAIDRAIAIDELNVQSEDFAIAEEITRGFISPGMAAERERNLANWSADQGELEEQAMEIFQGRIEQRGRDLDMSRSEARAAIPSGVWAGFSDLVEGAYAVTGNLEASVAVAERSFFGRYAVTYQNGEPVWQFGAAEAVYRVHDDPARNAAWINNQAHDVAADALGEVPVDLMLVPTGDPMREAEPEYTIIARTEDGRTVTVPRAFRPDRLRELEMIEREMRGPAAVRSQADGAATALVRDAEVVDIELTQLQVEFSRFMENRIPLDRMTEEQFALYQEAYNGFNDRMRELRTEKRGLIEEAGGIVEAATAPRTAPAGLPPERAHLFGLGN